MPVLAGGQEEFEVFNLAWSNEITSHILIPQIEVPSTRYEAVHACTHQNFLHVGNKGPQDHEPISQQAMQPHGSTLLSSSGRSGDTKLARSLCCLSNKQTPPVCDTSRILLSLIFSKSM